MANSQGFAFEIRVKGELLFATATYDACMAWGDRNEIPEGAEVYENGEFLEDL